jgi:phosphatidylinositol glycan class O
MGDDTWTIVFPNSFTYNYPYDSFNVEDLHTVDSGVIRHLFPLMNPAHRDNGTWDVLIGHFLGVDHVGHRLGPEHSTMRSKLYEMDSVLRELLQVLAEDDLLVVLGDHGMDRRGDHGGDGDLETSAGLWMYSKKPLRPSVSTEARSPLETVMKTFPGANVAHRRVQQIDLVPTLSLLLGLPIPFNNLGTVIPELFAGNDLEMALMANSAQVGAYLDAYRNSSSGGELGPAWDMLQKLRVQADIKKAEPLETVPTYLRAALDACRSMWAQFDAVLMVLGLSTIAISLAASTIIFVLVGQKDGIEAVDDALAFGLRGMAGGAVIAILVSLATQNLNTFKGIDSLDWTIFFAPFIGSAVVIGICLSNNNAGAKSLEVFKSISLGAILPVLHSLSFFSNSFTFWEDRTLLFFLLSALIEPIRAGLAAPTPTLRKRILISAAIFGVAARLMGMSTVCREEQQPYCTVTFFASAVVAVPPQLIRILVLPVALALPSIIQSRLAVAKADHGAAALVLPNALRPALVAGTVYWLLDWADTVDYFGLTSAPTLRLARTGVAWVSLIFVILGLFGSVLLPTCLKITVDNTDPLKANRVVVLGYANAFGSAYLILWTTVLALVWLTSQLTSQIVLTLATVALLAHLEMVDALRDVHDLNEALKTMNPSQLLKKPSSTSNTEAQTAEPVFSPGAISFSTNLVPLAILAMHTFFSTGHNATIPSIQWKSAFVLTPNLTYPFSPVLVVINTFGPIFLFALAAPLLSAWNIAPRPVPASGDAVLLGSVRAMLGVQIYFSALLLGAAGSAAHLRRHLMVWKVFAPRFMLAAASLLAVDVAAILGVVGLFPTVRYMAKVFAVPVAKEKTS